MTKNTRIVIIAAIATLVLLAGSFIGRDLLLRSHRTLDCGDGLRSRIDIRDFTTTYSSHSIELEAKVADKITISTKVTPVQLQQLSESMQSSNEFRKYLVAGYNSCAITKAQYSNYGVRYQALDNLAHEINQLVGRSSVSKEENEKLRILITEYSEIARKLGRE